MDTIALSIFIYKLYFFGTSLWCYTDLSTLYFLILSFSFCFKMGKALGTFGDYLHGFWRCRCLQRMPLLWLDKCCWVYFLTFYCLKKLREVRVLIPQIIYKLHFWTFVWDACIDLWLQIAISKGKYLHIQYVHTCIHEHVCVHAAIVGKACRFLLNSQRHYVLSQENKQENRVIGHYKGLLFLCNIFLYCFFFFWQNSTWWNVPFLLLFAHWTL